MADARVEALISAARMALIADGASPVTAERDALLVLPAVLWAVAEQVEDVSTHRDLRKWADEIAGQNRTVIAPSSIEAEQSFIARSQARYHLGAIDKILERERTDTDSYPARES